MRAQLDAGADALAFVGTRQDAFNDVVAEARERGVPVVAFDLDAPGSGRLLFVGMEAPYQAGRRVGEQMAALVGGGATVLVQTGSDQAPGAVGKRAGFVDVMAGHGITVVEAPSDGEDPAHARALAEALLEDNPQATGMFGVYGYHPIVQAKAVHTLGRDGSVAIVGFDLLPETVELLESGAVAKSTWIQEYYFGFYAAAAISDLVRLGIREALTLRGMDAESPAENVFVPRPVTFTRQTIGTFRKWSDEKRLAQRTTATSL
ncbi:substrate-binding domain-containing protein [Nonomuraea sp. K274]|uniref:Substrate-binding domain-containing protein n=2 Tax=Nonomuraea cypriaca TaxID=1187855 RepID=A0A931APH8_9ACTN|nr:substrate-binding domain-containing protein [Nonomuraea cypriaca]